MGKTFLASFVFIVSLVFLSSVVFALQTPTITFIPEKFSANAGFIAKAETGDNEPIRIEWTVIEARPARHGLFPRINDKFTCRFSNTDKTASCGPTPFKEKTTANSPYTFLIKVEDAAGNFINSTIKQPVGGIQLNTELNVVDSNVYIVVTPYGVSIPAEKGITYSVYNENLMPIVKDKSLTYEISGARYKGNETLDPGVYYFAFSASTDTDFGGTLIRKVIGIEDTGSGIIDADYVTREILTSKNTETITGFKITNLGNTSLSDLSTKVSSDLEEYLEIQLEKNNLTAGTSSYFTVNLKNLDTGIDINTKVTVLSGSQIVGNIPVDIKISKKKTEDCGSCDGKANLALCLGGKCCNEKCIFGAECCSQNDCTTGEECSNNKCKTSTSGCLSGSCYEICPNGTKSTGGTCTTDADKSGICCAEISEDECKGKSNMMMCAGGKCCNEKCIFGAECCSDDDCDSGEECSGYKCKTTSGDCDLGDYCYETCPDGYEYTGSGCTTDAGVSGECCKIKNNGNGDGGSITTMIIIVVIVILGAVGAWFYLTKIRGKGGEAGFDKDLEEEY